MTWDGKKLVIDIYNEYTDGLVKTGVFDIKVKPNACAAAKFSFINESITVNGLTLEYKMLMNDFDTAAAPLSPLPPLELDATKFITTDLSSCKILDYFVTFAIDETSSTFTKGADTPWLDLT